jgi:hypothetical protein
VDSISPCDRRDRLFGGGSMPFAAISGVSVINVVCSNDLFALIRRSLLASKHESMHARDSSFPN